MTDGLPIPDPPLRAGELLLRPWHLDDAPTLVAAWADEDIQRWTAVPERRDRATAERWIAGDDHRRARWLGLDLVVERNGEVVGEVGLFACDRSTGTVEIGWWTAHPHRGQHIASSAAGLLAGWAIRELGLRQVLARCQTDNPASIIVAGRAGFRSMLSTDDAEVLVRAE